MIIKNELFYWVIVGFITLLLIINILNFLQFGAYISLLPITVQLILLIALLFKYRYSKILLKIWVIVFIIAASALQLLGQLLKSFQYELSTNVIIWNLINGLIGVSLLILINRAFTVKNNESDI